MRRHLLSALAVATLVLSAPALCQAKTFELETASVADIQAAVDAGALTYEKLVMLCQARIQAYNESGPALHAFITLNPKALDEARARDAQFKATGRPGPLFGIPLIPKDNYDTADLPTTAGSFLLDGSVPPQDATIIKKLRDAGMIILGKANLNEFASGGAGTPSGFSSLGGQTRNPHDPTRNPGGSSGGTGASIAAWFAPLGLGSDTGGSIRNPCSFNGIVGIKPTNGLVSRAGIVPLTHSLDTGGPMGRTVSDIALALGFMTGLDDRDPLTATQIGLAYTDYTQFLKKDALKGARIGVNRNLVGMNADVDAIFDRAVAELKAAGAVIIDPVVYPDYIMAARAGISTALRNTEFREEMAKYLATLKPGYPQNLTEMSAKADTLTAPTDRYSPNWGLFEMFKVENAGPSSASFAYKAVKEYGMPMFKAAVVGVFEQYKLDAMIYTTNPTPAPTIIPPFKAKPGTPMTTGVSLTNIANITNFPDVIVPAGVTGEKLPVTISFFGVAYSEPKLLAYAYAYEQATHHRVAPATTPALPGEKFDY